MRAVLGAGDVIERYRIASVLGEGGMAVVYLVEHDRLGTRHALKVLTVGNRDVQRRTLQEGKLQATLRHPNIVAVTDVLDIDGAPALLMEYIEGPPLDAWLHTYRPPLDEALQLFRGILAGVKYAHDQGLIHRDLKPANVLLQPTAEGVVPKVTDFGLAKSLGADGAGLRKTRTGATMGTPAYMAPEQIRDASSVDRRADVYALGCILYELVCGRPPYDAPDLLSLFAQVNAGSYPAPDTVVAGLPPAVCAAIRGALHGDSAHRFADCDAFAAALYEPRPDAPPLRALPGGVTLFPDSPGARAIQTLIASRGATPSPHRSRDDTSGTWLDNPATDERAKRSPAAAASRTVAATSAQTSVTSLAPLPAPWSLAARVAAGVGVLGLVALVGLGSAGAALLVNQALAPSPAPAIIQAPSSLPDNVAVAPAAVAPAAAVPPATPTTADPPPPRAAIVATTEPPVKPRVTPRDTPPPVITSVVATTPAPTPTVPPPVVAPPAAPTGASMSFTGADRVVLVDGTGKEWPAGDGIPAGTYQVRAWFAGATDGVGAGRVTIGDGQALVLRCNDAIAQCKKV